MLAPSQLVAGQQPSSPYKSILHLPNKMNTPLAQACTVTPCIGCPYMFPYQSLCCVFCISVSVGASIHFLNNSKVHTHGALEFDGRLLAGSHCQHHLAIFFLTSPVPGCSWPCRYC